MKSIIAIITAGLMFLGGLFAHHSTPVAAQTCFDIKPADIIALTNKERSVPLVENNQLDRAAQLKAQDMITNHYWAHVSPTGVTPWAWLNKVGYSYVYAGENLEEASSGSATAAIAGWMASPGHKANILNPHYTETGVAVVCGSTDRPTTLIVSEYASQ